MATVHVFVSFDVDHDTDCKIRLGREAMPPGSHFALVDWSIRELADDWRAKATKRIANVDLVLIICGEHADTAPNVNHEIEIARQVGVPYLLLAARADQSKRPAAALDRDRLLEMNVDSAWVPAAAAQ